MTIIRVNGGQAVTTEGDPLNSRRVSRDLKTRFSLFYSINNLSVNMRASTGEHDVVSILPTLRCVFFDVDAYHVFCLIS